MKPEKARELYWRDPEKNRKRVREYWRRLRAEQPDKVREYKRQWRANNLEKAKAAEHRADRRRRPSKNAYLRKRRATDVNFMLYERIRSSLKDAVKGRRKAARAKELLGCSLDSFKIYLESLFQPGMSFENYGKWHIDHIMPVSIFDLTNPEHQRRCFHFSNMQPMWARENIQKSNKIPLPA